MKIKRRKPRKKPIPWAITLELALLRDGLSQEQWEREIRRVVRSKMPTTLQQMENPGLFELYDDHISAIIEEELVRN